MGLYVAAALWAATVIVAPESLTETSGSWRDTGSSAPPGSDVSAIDGTGDTWATSTWNSDFICNDSSTGFPFTATLNFPTPTNAPASTASAQKIRIAYAKGRQNCTANAAKGDATFTVRVYDGSSEVTIVNAQSCTDTIIATLEPTWTYNGGSDGSEVYVEIDNNGNGATGTNSRNCMIEYLDWYEVEAGGGAADELMVVRHRRLPVRSVDWAG